VERFLEIHVRVDRVVRRLGDLADRRRLRIEARRHDFTHERLPRQNTQKLAVPRDEDRPHLRARQQLSRLGRRGLRIERPRLRHHRLAHLAHG
jgi:hypothetical protein